MGLKGGPDFAEARVLLAGVGTHDPKLAVVSEGFDCEVGRAINSELTEFIGRGQSEPALFANDLSAGNPLDDSWNRMPADEEIADTESRELATLIAQFFRSHAG